MSTSQHQRIGASEDARLLRHALEATHARGERPDQVERLLSVLFARSVRAVALASCFAPLAACSDEEGTFPPPSQNRENSSVPDAALVPELPRYDASADATVDVLVDAGAAGDPFSPIPCVDGKPDARVDQFTLSIPVDYVSYGHSWVDGTTTDAERGQACKTATDRDACLLAIAEAAQKFAFDPVKCQVSNCPPQRFVLTTKGDTVRGFGESDLLQLLSPVDSAAEAWYLARVVPGAPWASCSAATADERVASEREVDDGFELRGTVQTRSCDPMETSEVTYHIARDGTGREVSRTTVSVKPGCIVAGRRPTGLLATLEPSAKDALGLVFSRMAYLEAASVDAFLQLEEELIALCAPAALVTAAREARLDEVDHAARMHALAHRFGGRQRKVVVAPRTLRSAFELALDNAVEGCVRETFGALLATHQAEHASDEEIRTTMRIIARDETRHAALSWQVAEFIRSKLTPQQADQIARAQQLALRDLVDEIEEPCRRERELLGTPSRAQARLLLSSLWPLVAGQQSAA